ncbi:MAG: hypothetical protein AAF468_02225 [Pseudomonadota bacterium]
MSISAALANNAQSAQSAQLQYQRDVLFVASFCTAVMASKLPNLHTNPSNWSDITSAYEAATREALIWANSVIVKLEATPAEINNYESTITATLTDALNNTSTLISDPTSNSAKSALNADLNTLSSTLNLITVFLQSTITAIQDFSDTVPNMATQLNTVVNQAVQASDADQDQINQLNQSIDNLNEQIKDYWEDIGQLTGLAVAEACVSTLATVAAWPEGGLVWLLFGPTILIQVAMIALDAVKLYDAYETVGQLTTEMDNDTSDMAALSALANQYQGFANQVSTVESKLQQILDVWQQIETDVNNAITDINDASDDYNSSDWSSVQTDLTNAQTSWGDAYALSQSLTITLTGSDADLAYGMTQQQVQDAYNASNVTPFVNYINDL